MKPRRHGGAQSSLLAQIAAQAGEEALRRIGERFESGPLLNHLPYHDRAHTSGVIAKAERIADALGLGEHDRLLTTIAAAFHDTVQDWTMVCVEGGVVKRVRHTGANEVASAQEAAAFMRGTADAFEPEDYGTVAAAILATIPSWNPGYATVVHPFLVRESPLVAWAVALADLGSCGMAPEEFLGDGPQLFAEENLDIVQALATVQHAGEIDAPTQGQYRQRYLSWLIVQPDFARGRRAYLADAQIGALDTVQSEALGQLFCCYDESIQGAEAAVEEAQLLPFVTLMRQLHPGAFPGEPDDR